MKMAFYILPADKEWAQQRVAELERQINDLGPEFEEVFGQSSETWHDNAPFDALRDKQSLMAAERQNLRQLINKAALTLPKSKKAEVGLGSLIVVEEDGKVQRFFIAGHWSPHTGTVVNEAMVITCGSPLGLVLMGTKEGQTAVLDKPSRRLLIKSVLVQ